MIVPGSANSLLLAQGASTGYNLTKSLRVRASADAGLTKTFSSSGNRQKYTYSFWAKFDYNAGAGYREFIYETTATYNFVNLYQYQGKLNFFGRDLVTGTIINYTLATDAVFRDPSSWYHIVYSIDYTQATAANRVKIYVNGVQYSLTATNDGFPPQNWNGYLNVGGYATLIGRSGGGDNYDGYLAEVNFIDGQQLTPSSFGENNATTGVWQPIRYTGTYGTNGFYLPFTDTTSTTTLGYDSSGNGNNWTTNNFSLTAGSTYDSMTDVPTLTSATTANYAVLNPNATSPTNKPTVSNGNLKQVGNGGWMQGGVLATMGITSGKYYWETTVTALETTNGYIFVGVAPGNYKIPSGNDAATTVPGQSPYYGACVYPRGASLTEFYANAAASGGTNIYSGFGQTVVGDVIQVAFDADSGKIWFGRNNTWYNSGVPASGTNPTATLTTAGYTPFIPCNGTYDSTDGLAVNFGQQPFTYTPPTGYVALNTYNLPTSTIVKGNTVMDATTYTSNGGVQTVTNTAGFKPDFVWIKDRSSTASHDLMDSVRGASKYLLSNTTGAEVTDANFLTSFNSNGFSLGSSNYNGGDAFVGWQWQAGQGTTSSNTNGSITSTVSVNPTAGFSVATFTSPSSGNFTIGHGLGVKPAMFIVKTRDTAGWNWGTWHQSLSSNTNSVLNLNTTAAESTSFNMWGASGANSTTIGITAGNPVPASSSCVCYAWAEIAGFSKFGSYTGNGSNDGPFVYTGFRPKYILIKLTSGAGYDWYVYDSVRETYNVAQTPLFPNSSSAESANSAFNIDILSNGFKCRATYAGNNGNGSTYIYAAFAENPFKNALAR